MSGRGRVNGRFADLSAMQDALFRQPTSRPDPRELPAVARRLLRLTELAAFQVFVVGSMLTRPDSGRDVDILLCRRSNRKLTVRRVRAALVAARLAGLSAFGVSVDPCFRNTTSDLLWGVLPPERRIVTWKLEDHLLSLRCALGLEKHFRRAPGGLIITSRTARDFNYYRKLPECRSPDGVKARWLQPAVPLDRLASLR